MNRQNHILREPVVAGSFYPANASQLSTMIDQFLDLAKNRRSQKPPKAVISPHAGYIYSGAIAASVFVTIDQFRDQYSRVVVMGPSHRIGFRGVAYCRADVFKTPLGHIPVDMEALKELEKQNLILRNDSAHLQEHSLEVQLPFLQKTLDEFTLIPLVVGESSSAEVSEIIEALWGGDETLFVISSDLSHYLAYEAAVSRDQKTSNAILHFEYQKLEYGDACGRNPIKGLLRSASQHHLHPTLIDYRNSGDTAGDKTRVVGYGAYLFD